MAYVYILKSLKDSKKYIGSTIDLKKRINEHNQGKVKSTKWKKPLALIGYEYFEKIEDASIFEKKYKRSHDLLLRKIKSGNMKIVRNGM